MNTLTIAIWAVLIGLFALGGILTTMRKRRLRKNNVDTDLRDDLSMILESILSLDNVDPSPSSQTVLSAIDGILVKTNQDDLTAQFLSLYKSIEADFFVKASEYDIEQPLAIMCSSRHFDTMHYPLLDLLIISKRLRNYSPTEDVNEKVIHHIHETIKLSVMHRMTSMRSECKLNDHKYNTVVEFLREEFEEWNLSLLS